MKENISEFDMIQKALYHTYHVLANENAELAANEMKAAEEHYLQALSHKTLIDMQYLKRMIE
jgi:hypothetical protein